MHSFIFRFNYFRASNIFIITNTEINTIAI
jgi:hypothetical protein